jgi:dolichol kinase
MAGDAGDGGADDGDGRAEPPATDGTDIDELGPFSEVRRRAVHVSGTLVPLPHLLVPELVPWRYVLWFCLAGAAAAAVLEALRLGGRVDWRIFEELTREYEAENLAGYALYAFSFAVVAVALGPATTPSEAAAPLAVPAMLMLSVGDPVAGLLGSSDADGVKQASVLAAMFVVCLALAVPFVPMVAAVAGAAVATVADGVKPVVWGYVIDDNVTIPLGGGAAMWVATAVV